MQELEKILEEIELEKKRISLSRDCSNEHAVIEISLLEKIEDIIRKHMNNGERFEFDFTNVKSFDCQCGRHYVNTGAENNDGWIPVEERLPEVDADIEETIEDDDCPEYLVTIRGASESTVLKYSLDGAWFDENGYVYDVIAWCPLPEPYRPERSE